MDILIYIIFKLCISSNVEQDGEIIYLLIYLCQPCRHCAISKNFKMLLNVVGRVFLQKGDNYRNTQYCISQV